ncbi:MAG: phosphatase PAP2 family protein [Gemmatimonadota bacterium]
MSPAADRAPTARRLVAIVGVILLHLAAYLVVTRVNESRPPPALWDPSLPLDGSIPYLPWTWTWYWAAYPYLTIVAALVLLRLPADGFGRAIVAYVGLTLAGAAIQVLFPVRAPWPTAPGPMQALMHEAAFTRPFASLPSMHVAYSVFTASLGVAAARTRVLKVGHVAVAALITASTLTLKEHYVLDAVTGTALGLGTMLWWSRARIPSPRVRPRRVRVTSAPRG